MAVGAVEHRELCVWHRSRHRARLGHWIENVCARANHECPVLDAVEDGLSRSSAAPKIVGIHCAKERQVGVRIETLHELLSLIAEIGLRGEDTIV